MAKAIIEFREIFLFAMRKESLTVFAPAKGHDAYFSGPHVPRTLLQNHVITLLKDGKPALGKVNQETEPYMVNLDGVLGQSNYRVKQTARLGASLVSGRFELGGNSCWLESAPLAPGPGDEDYVLKPWKFGDRFTHMLTNRAFFTIDLHEGQYELLIEQAGSPTAKVPVSGGDIFIAQAVDRPTFTTSAARTTLDEFALFYELLEDPHGKSVTGPLPYDPNPSKRAQTAPRLNIACIRPGCPNAACQAG